MAKITRDISFEQFGDMLRGEWEQGHLSDESARSILEGFVPRHLRELGWTIERFREGIRLTIDDLDLDESLKIRRAS